MDIKAIYFYPDQYKQEQNQFEGISEKLSKYHWYR